MTIDIIMEVSCDGCGDTHQVDGYASRNDVWKNYLKTSGWKRKGDCHWCQTCVRDGTWKRKFIEWLAE